MSRSPRAPNGSTRSEPRGHRSQVEGLDAPAGRVSTLPFGGVLSLLNHGAVGDAGGDRRLLNRPLLALPGVPASPVTSRVSLPGGLVSSPGVCSILARRRR